MMWTCLQEIPGPQKPRGCYVRQAGASTPVAGVLRGGRTQGERYPVFDRDFQRLPAERL